MTNQLPPRQTNKAEDLQRQLDVILDALDSSQDGIAIWQAIRGLNRTVQDFKLILMNLAGASAAGKPRNELIDSTLTAVVGVDTAVGLRTIFTRALADGHELSEIIPDVDPEGVRGFYENSVVPFGEDLVFATYRDVSKSVEERERLLWLSEHDFLTGMPNRAKLQESMLECISSCKETGGLFGFAFVDIDNFKSVNDTFGHGVGDALLVNFVKRIRHSLPENAFVSRISGDEFAILLSPVKGEEQLRDLMDEVFAAMSRPFDHDDIEVSITCSAGCVLSDGSDSDEEILKVSDQAMYEAKHSGRARYTVRKI